METNVTQKTHDLVEAWIAAKKSMAAAEARYSEAQKNLESAQNALGNWLTPDDVRQNETFNIWFGSGILETRWANSSEPGVRHYFVGWRKEPEGKQLREQGS